MAEENHELDLPLHSNIDNVRVTHYNLELTCDMQKKIFHGYVDLMIIPTDALSVTKTQKPMPQHSQVEEIPVKVETVKIHELTSIVSNQQVTGKVEYQERMGADGFSTVDKQVCTEMIEECVGHSEILDVCTFNGANISDTNTQLTDAKVYDSNLEDKECKVNFECIQGIGRIVDKNHADVQTRDNEAEVDDKEERVFNKMNEMESEDSLKRTNIKLLDKVSFFKDTTGRRNGFTDTVCEITELSDHSYTNTCLEDNPKVETTAACDFVMVLDSWDLQVYSVHAIDVQNADTYIDKSCIENKGKLKELLDECDKNHLMFFSEKTCLKFWKPGIKHAKQFPKFIRISYQTKPDGPSLKWTTDQDGRPCVFTHGHWINNRSLFPSQDVPRALATWRAYMHVPKDMTVLMSGDQNPEIRCTSHHPRIPLHLNYLKTYIFHTDMVVPSSTLALAAGYWTEVEIISCSGAGPSLSGKRLPCRLFTPKTHQYLASTLIGSYIPRCMDAAFVLLGCHPFKRLDILIVPASFASLGMASPSLLFLSQSVLSNDGQMLIRVAHEMSHSWFGLAIGPSDWHEEWLSEGFCTYTESVIHSTANQMTFEQFSEEREIYDHIKMRILEAEIESTSTDLQTLRNAYSDDVGEKNDGDHIKNDGKNVKFVSNGMNPDKGLLQVHYLKGYFLLRFLEDLVGYSLFLDFLKHLVETFHHMLIDSMDVLGLFFETFPDERSAQLSEETLLRDWLNSPGLPKVSGKVGFEQNKLVKEVSALESRVHECNTIWTKLHWRKRRKIDVAQYLQIPKLKQVKLTLFLDRLLDLKNIHPKLLYHLNEQLGLAQSNADVRHKWCELVVKNRLQDSYNDIRHFLIHQQAMGVYLFGELIISQDRKQRKLAEECFTSVCDDMEEGVKNVVKAMIYGS